MRTELLTAAFFMEGLHEASYDPKVKPNFDVLIETWGKGCIELVDALVRYVPFTTQLCDAAVSASDGTWPGVFDYEVSSPFGRWFGEYVLEHGDEPPHAEAKAWLVKEVTAFFTQGLNEVEAKVIREAINTMVTQ